MPKAALAESIHFSPMTTGIRHPSFLVRRGEGHLNSPTVSKPVKIIRAGLHQDGHVQLGEPDRICYSFFVAKVWQTDQDAFDAISVDPVWLSEADSKLGAVETWAITPFAIR